jgi:hypothetical protein
MTADIEVARQAEAPGAVTWRGQGGPLQPRTASRQREAILVVILLAAVAKVAHVAMFVIALAAIRGLVRDSQVIPRTLTWYFGPVSAWHNRRLKRRYLRQQRLDEPTG